jgi:hypothetical protein
VNAMVGLLAQTVARARAEKWADDVTAREMIRLMRQLDPHAVARAADRLGIPPTDAARLVGTWSIMIDEVMR